MMNYQPGDLVLIAFPFSSGAQAKNRPALVILDVGDEDIVVARVTTQLTHTPFDVPLADWQAAGLRAPSVARLHKLATLTKSSVSRFLGRLQGTDRQAVGAVLTALAAGW